MDELALTCGVLLVKSLYASTAIDSKDLLVSLSRPWKAFEDAWVRLEALFVVVETFD